MSGQEASCWHRGTTLRLMGRWHAPGNAHDRSNKSQICVRPKLAGTLKSYDHNPYNVWQKADDVTPKPYK